MLSYPDIDPVAFSIFSIHVNWYGLMYVIGFLSAFLLGIYRADKKGSGWTRGEVSDLIAYTLIGVFLGGRIGYFLFYQPSYLVGDPLEILKVYKGGMSFHGGLLGTILGIWLFARKYNKSLFEVGDFAAVLVGPGLCAGRIGNFINGELWGKHTTAAWGMVFPGAGPFPRHPSQLYEALLEGLLLFIILWIFSAKPRPRMAASGMFLLLYGSFRFFVEFFREPDSHMGYLAFDWLTMGQILCMPMILAGILLLCLSAKNKSRRL